MGFLFAFTGKITSREGRFEYSDLSSIRQASFCYHLGAEKPTVIVCGPLGLINWDPKERGDELHQPQRIEESPPFPYDDQPVHTCIDPYGPSRGLFAIRIHNVL